MTITAELNQKAKAILISELGRLDYARFKFLHILQTAKP